MKTILPIVISLLCSCDIVKTSFEANAEVNGDQTENFNDTASDDLDNPDTPDNNQNNQSGLSIQYNIVDCYVTTINGYKIVQYDNTDFLEEAREGGYLTGLPYQETNSYGDRCIYSRNDGISIQSDTDLLNSLPDGFVTGTHITPYIKPL